MNPTFRSDADETAVRSGVVVWEGVLQGTRDGANTGRAVVVVAGSPSPSDGFMDSLLDAHLPLRLRATYGIRRGSRNQCGSRTHFVCGCPLGTEWYSVLRAGALLVPPCVETGTEQARDG